jgi:hypothetical protein
MGHRLLFKPLLPFTIYISTFQRLGRKKKKKTLHLRASIRGEGVCFSLSRTWRRAEPLIEKTNAGANIEKTNAGAIFPHNYTNLTV